MNTDLIAMVAIWLVVNSHLEAYYPRPWLAIDGYMGNALVFLLSGYGVQMSLMNRDQSFAAYGWRRLVRLYPAAILVGVIFDLLIKRHWQSDSAGELFQRLIYPTRYTYIGFIVPFYVLLYVLGRRRSPRAANLAVGGGAVCYLAATTGLLGLDPVVPDGLPKTAVEYWAHGWMTVALGMWLAINNVRSRLTLPRVGAVIGVMLAYYAVRFVILVPKKAIYLYRLVDLLVLVAIVLIFITIGQPSFVSKIRRWPLIGPFMAFSAVWTLEIYVLHHNLLEIPAVGRLPFPLNVIALAVATFVAAWALHAICEAIRVRLEPRKEPQRLPGDSSQVASPDAAR